MRAARLERYGGPDVVGVVEVDDPEPGPGEIVVDIAAAGVNFPDLLIMDNRYQVSAPLPFTPGSEFAGTVSAIGDGVERRAVGERVVGAQFVGAFAEKIVVAATAVSPTPDGMSSVDAAAFRVTYRTAVSSLSSIAGTEPGEWVAVLGSSGGVGTATIDVAKRLGAHVVAVARGTAKTAICSARGADAVIDATTEDVKARIKEITDGGADVVIDPIGGPLAEEALRAMRWGGRFVTVGYAVGEIPRIPLNLVLLKGVTIKGCELRTYSDHAPEAARADERLLASLVAGGMRPLVSAVHPLDDIRAALRTVAEHRVTGKIVLAVRPDE